MADHTKVTAKLAENDIGFYVVNNPSGWCVEVSDPIAGKDLESLIKFVDTQSSIIACVTPNVGLTVQTMGFEYPEEMSA